MAHRAEEEERPKHSPEPHVPILSSMNPTPSWFTPKRLLAIFCVINLLNYLDRGAIASNGVNGSQETCSNGTCTPGTGIQGDFKLNNFEDGILSSAFMVGLLVASPIFASLTNSVNPFRLIGVGLSVWTIATLCCGFSFNFWSIAVCRTLVGVGEASFISLAAPFVDDAAPVAQKTMWLAIFYMCIPSGYAVGYVFGGLIGTQFGWRYAFWIESILMLPFVIFGFVMKPLHLKGFDTAESKALAPETVVLDVQDGSLSSKAEFGDKSSHEPSKPKAASRKLNQLSRFLEDIKVLLFNKVYVINILGYMTYNFVIGAYSYWGPKAGHSIYHMANADMIFGGITIVCGTLGTLGGGFLLDFLSNTLSNAFKVLAITTFLGAAFCFGAFLFESMYGFLALFAVGEILVFATQGPVNYVCLQSVTPNLRPLSMAILTVAIHVFGDVPSSPLIGVVQDRINNWRTTALILTSIFFLAAAIWFIGIFFASVDKFNEDSENQVSTAERTNTTPLLEEKTRGTEASPSPSPSPLSAESQES